jgi:hypothetical protein
LSLFATRTRRIYEATGDGISHALADQMTWLAARAVRRLFIPLFVFCLAACGGSLPADRPDAAAGTGGGGGSGAIGGEAGIVAGGCGTHEPLGPSARVNTLGPVGGAYDGPAIIERSNEQSMVIIFQSAAADGGAPLPVHAEITQLTPMPILPVGARVWLSKLPAGNQPSFSFSLQPWALSLRNRQGGDLLFGMSRDAQDQAASPVRVGAPTPRCSGPNPDFCGPGSVVTYEAVEVRGDRDVVVGDSETAVVPIGGIDYDVRVGAQHSTQPTSGVCGDYFPPNGVSLDVRAHDLAPLASALAVEPLPACADGNETDATLWAFLINAGLTQTYDGPVRFISASAASSDLSFTVDLPPQVGVPPTLEISVSPQVFPAPAANAEFWFTMRASHTWVLRGAQRGPVLLANGGATTTTTAGLTDLATELGVSFTAEQRCAYGTGSAGAVQHLFDAVVGTNPPVRVTSRKTTLVQIAGRDYSVFMNGVGFAGLSLAAR